MPGAMPDLVDWKAFLTLLSDSGSVLMSRSSSGRVGLGGLHGCDLFRSSQKWSSYLLVCSFSVVMICTTLVFNRGWPVRLPVSYLVSLYTVSLYTVLNSPIWAENIFSVLEDLRKVPHMLSHDSTCFDNWTWQLPRVARTYRQTTVFSKILLHYSCKLHILGYRMNR